MKSIFFILFLTILLNAKIDFSKHVVNGEFKDIQLSVTNVVRNDVLHLRAEASSKSKIIYRIPYDAKNLITYDKNIVKKIGTDRWVSVRLNFFEGFYDGWVKAKYIKLYEKYSAFTAGDLAVFYPDFLKAKKTSSGWIDISSRVDFEHYSVCSDKEGLKLQDEFIRFDIKLKLYYSLLDVFTKEKFYDIDTYENITQHGWFKDKTNGFVKKINFYGLEGYKNSIGSEGCGVNTYYFKIKGKVLVIREPFDNTLPIVKDKKKLPDNLKFEEKEQIMRYIIDNLKVL